MRNIFLFPYHAAPEEAVRYFQRGFWRYFFPRFPLLAVYFWLLTPAVHSLWHQTSSFTMRWADLFTGASLGCILSSYPFWLGYKRSYRDFLEAAPKTIPPEPNHALQPTAGASGSHSETHALPRPGGG